MSARMKIAAFLTAAGALTTPIAQAQLTQDTNAMSCTSIKTVDGTTLAFGQVAPGSLIQHQPDGSCYDMGVPPPVVVVVPPPPPVVGVLVAPGPVVGVVGGVNVYIGPDRRPVYRCDRHDCRR